MAEHENIGAALAVQGPEGVEVPRTLAAIGAEIREHAARMEYHKRGTLWEAVEIGRRLTEARDKAAHGEWADFLARETGYTSRMASNFMRVFEAYGDRQNELFQNVPEVNRKSISDLSLTQAIVLLAVPEENRDQFVEENDVENMTVRELKEAVRREREEREAAERDRDEAREELESKAQELTDAVQELTETSASLEASRNRERELAGKAADAAQERDRVIADLDRKREDSEGTALRISELEEKLDAAEARRDAMAEKLEQAKADAENAERSRAEMERQMQVFKGVHEGTLAELDELKKKPTDVAVEPIADEEAIEAAREEVRAELQAQYDADMADLREKLAAAQSAPAPAPTTDKDMGAFEVIFNQVQGQINALLGLVLKIEGRGDTHTAQRLRNALLDLSVKVAEAAQGKQETEAETKAETEGATA